MNKIKICSVLKIMLELLSNNYNRLRQMFLVHNNNQSKRNNKSNNCNIMNKIYKRILINYN